MENGKTRERPYAGVHVTPAWCLIHAQANFWYPFVSEPDKTKITNLPQKKKPYNRLKNGPKKPERKKVAKRKLYIYILLVQAV